MHTDKGGMGMRKEIVVPVTLALAGLILIFSGVGAYVTRRVPMMNVAVTALGIILLALTPITWGYIAGKIPQKKTIAGIFFICALCITLGSSYYSAHLAKSEIVHFWVFFPAGRGPPASPLEIYVNDQGFLKRILNPWMIALSTHWIINTGDKPYIVGLRLVNCTIPVEWEVNAGIPWDHETKTFTQPLEPGEGVPYLGIDWIFHIPKEIRPQRIWYDGGLAVIDSETGETLSFIPITIYGSET